MTDFFSGMIKFQESALAVQRLQLDAARKLSAAAGDSIKMQKNGLAAAQAGFKAWEATLAMWGMGK